MGQIWLKGKPNCLIETNNQLFIGQNPSDNLMKVSHRKANMREKLGKSVPYL